MKCLSVFVLLFSCALLPAVLQAAEGNFSKQQLAVNDQVVLAGLIDLDALRAAHAGDVLVIDLRTEAEGTPAEAASAAELGLAYRNIPVGSAQVDAGQLDELRTAVAEANGLVVIHCASGNRAAMLWGAGEVADGRSFESVRTDLSEILNKQPTIDGLEAYSRSLDAEP